MMQLFLLTDQALQEPSASCTQADVTSVAEYLEGEHFLLASSLDGCISRNVGQ